MYTYYIYMIYIYMIHTHIYIYIICHMYDLERRPRYCTFLSRYVIGALVPRPPNCTSQARHFYHLCDAVDVIASLGSIPAVCRAPRATMLPPWFC